MHASLDRIGDRCDFHVIYVTKVYSVVPTSKSTNGSQCARLID